MYTMNRWISIKTGIAKPLKMPLQLSFSLQFKVPPIYSASVVESAIWVCSFECQIRGQLCIQITYLDLLFAVLASCCDTSCLHSPENDASACTSKDLLESGFIRIPLSFVAMRYFAICLTSPACDSFGFEENRAHWCTANDKSGRDPFSRKFSFPITDL